MASFRRAVALVLLWVATAAALPDLVPEVFDVSVDPNGSVDPGDVVEGCAGAATGRLLLNFALRSRNLGPSDLVMGDPGCPDCSTNPGAVCANPLYVCSPAHGHPHFESFSDAALLDGDGNVVVTGHKSGFCLLDLECATPQFSCGFQGLTAGCADVYDTGLPCQYIDLTDAALPDGDYTLRVTIDPGNAIAEADEGNNVVTAPVHIGGPVPPPPTTCPVVRATDLPRPLLDLTTAASSLTGTRPGTVTRLRVVDLAGTHTYVGDLEFRLRSPQGTVVTVVDHVCGGDNGFDLDLADGAATGIPCPPTDGGLHLPSAPLAPFVGELAAGTWTLEVADTGVADEGSLTSWGLELCTTCGDGTLDAGEVCDDGNGVDGDCCSADCQTAAATGAACSDAGTCVTAGSCQAGVCTGAASCDPCLQCQPPLGCAPPAHVLCESQAPRRAAVALAKRAEDPARDAVSWSWTAGAPVALLDFGSPTTVTDLTLCVFDQTGLRLSATAPAAGTCDGRPCWTSGARGLRYADRARTPDGIVKLSLRPGEAGRARILAKGKGANLALGALGLQGAVTVRLKRSGGPACWQSRFTAPARNDAGDYRARTP